MVDIKEVMMRKAGPLPVYAWVVGVGAFVGGFVLLKKKATGSTGTTGATGTATDQGTFNSSTAATTTDAAGNTTTTNYSASGPNSFAPGQLTNTAGAMPYSGGDTYVNLQTTPGNTSSTPTQTPTPIGPAYPPANPVAAGPGRGGGFWYTPKTDMNSIQAVLAAYNIPQASAGDVLGIEARATDAMELELANPQIDWSQHIPAGQAFFAPYIIGAPGVVNPLPQGASMTAPSGYTPPAQATSTMVPITGMFGPPSPGNQVPNSYFTPNL